VVIADASVWILFFNRPGSVEKRALDALIDSDEVVMAGVVLAELLQGCRTPKDRDEIKDVMLALPYTEMTRSVWIRTGEISSALLRRGMTLPIPDLILASLALEHGLQVYSLDKHFDRIHGLSRYAFPSL
jgi:predicted nucleic acid-binding protein